MKRIMDIVFSLGFILILTPVLLLIAIWIKLDSTGPVFYLQERIGLHRKPFRIYKFRTMHPDADKRGLLTVGGRDPRVTRAGYYLRKFKLDELPQFFNVLGGSMSLVGPRPEVKRYVDLYNSTQLNVLNVKPGITDYASIEYSDENELLGKAADPERTYIDEIMPAKLELNLKYINDQGIFTDCKILFRTFLKIVR
jgi:lipopolysaccharide/colanic/teichoic acid biosynthesis glycosyltransferase